MRARLPLQKSSFSLAMAPENCLMACKYSPLGTTRGRYDEHSSKSSLSCETKVYRTSRRKPNFRRWCLLASRHSEQWCQNIAGASSPSSNVKPAHNTTKNFAPNLRWGCQSHRLAVNKGLSVSSDNRIIVCKKVNRASNSKTVKQCKGNWTGVHNSLVVSLYKINNNMLGKQIIVGQLIEQDNVHTSWGSLWDLLWALRQNT
jgi:hypothetical protein